MKLFIHRKDLRTHDLAAWDLMARTPVETSLHLFILDPHLLKEERHLQHSGRMFLGYLNRLTRLYSDTGKPLLLCYGTPEDVVARVLDLHPTIREILWHRDTTPYAINRDRSLEQLATGRGVSITALVDSMLMDPADFQIYSGRKEPYKVFTPFYRKWSEYMGSYYKPASTIGLKDLRLVEPHPDLRTAFPLPFDLSAYGDHSGASCSEPREELDRFVDERMPAYSTTRDRYSLEEGASCLSAAINTGALSIRDAYEAASASPLSESWIRQLAWRDFYLYQSLYDPDFFRYEELYDFSMLDGGLLDVWTNGETGIPLIDAAMTQLNETGVMPNRLRMITAMFLTKNLLCPFPLGEAVFRRKLADYDNVLNRGGWLWSASLGFDPAPYFRIMNPCSQSQTHDPEGLYIRRWLPKLKHLSNKDIHLPQPGAIVDLKASRARAIEIYKELLSSRRSQTDESGIEKD